MNIWFLFKLQSLHLFVVICFIFFAGDLIGDDFTHFMQVVPCFSYNDSQSSLKFITGSRSHMLDVYLQYSTETEV